MEKPGFKPFSEEQSLYLFNNTKSHMFPTVRSLNRNTMHCGKQLGDLLTLDFYEAYAPPRFTRTV